MRKMKKKGGEGESGRKGGEKGVALHLMDRGPLTAGEVEALQAAWRTLYEARTAADRRNAETNLMALLKRDSIE
jgi:hypothetical protein